MPLPLRKEPDTLFNLSVNKLAFWFTGSWKCGEECVPISVQDDIFNRNSSPEITAFSRKVVSLKLDIPKLFDNLPVNIFNEIVPKVAAAKVAMNTFCLICLRKLLTIILAKRPKHWDMKTFLRREWYHKSHGIGIKSVFLSQVPTLKNIVDLRLRLVCDDSILRCIGENCHLIEYLDIEYSEVTDEGCMYLIPSENSAGCPKLQKLLLGEYRFDIASHTVALLLRNLPDIVYISYYNMRPALLEVCTLFDIRESQKSLVLQLKRLDFRVQWPNIPWNSVDIIRLSKLCPNLEELEIWCTKERDVLALKNFALLSQLHIKYKPHAIFPVAEVKQYFEAYCKQITSLRISCRILDTMFFSILGKHCSSLTKLIIECIKLVESKPFNRDEENNLKILSTFILEAKYLQDGSNLVMSDLLYKILKSTNRLTKVTLLLHGKCFSHQDIRFLLDVVDVRSLRCLITINSFNTRFDLTMESVNLILEKCPLLNTLGYLEYWDVLDSDVEKLKRDMEYSNYDIQIY